MLLAKVLDYNTKEKSILYEHPNTQEEKETSILGGKCKLQWKADWAMRWVALDVDYEMAGKDLIESVTLSGKKYVKQLEALLQLVSTMNYFLMKKVKDIQI